MATGSNIEISQRSKVTFNELNSEDIIKQRMLWSKDKWQEEGEAESSLNKLINSLRFWNKKIGKANGDKVTVLTVFNVNRFARIELLTIVDAIEELDKNIIIEGFSEFRNPRYIAVHFKTSKMKDLVESSLRKVGSDFAVFMAWAAHSETHNVRVHWLPLDHIIDNIRALVENYMNIIDVDKGSLSFMSGKKYKTGLLIFKTSLKADMKLEMLPHVTTVDGYEVLITVYGRDPMCLTCNCLGHISARCPTPYCRNCKSLHGNKETCDLDKNMDTYAQKVKGGVNNSDLEAALDGCDQPTLWEQTEASSPSIPTNKSRKNNKSYTLSNKNDKTDVIENLTLNKSGLQWEHLADSDSSDDVISSEDDSTKTIQTYSATSKKNKNVISMMKDHFKALQDLTIPDLQSGRALINPSKASSENSNLSQLDRVKMEVSGQSLKRKIETQGVAPVTGFAGKGTRKTYGKSSFETSSSAIVSNNLFDALTNKEEGD